jgi:Zn-dependent peptidase ImmA (M78 family)
MQRKWKDDIYAFNGWRKALEDKAILVFLVQKVRVKEMRGFSISNPPFPAIALNRKDSHAARSFSLHHEFTHILLNEPGLCEPLAIMHNGTQERRIEIFCNQVAGAVLVPPSDIQQNDTVLQHDVSIDWLDEEIFQIAKKFHVSKEVAMRRLVTLGMASPANYKQLGKLWKTRQLPTPEDKIITETGPQKILRLQGNAYVRLVLDAYRAEKITERDISDYLNMKLKHLDGLQESFA